LLPSGQVLVAGGLSGFESSTELYDPATGTWTATGSLITARSKHTATLLPNGKVLVAGGIGDNGTFLISAEVYDPATGLWSSTGSLATARAFHTATLLPDSKVLVAGGAGSNYGPLASAELYDPASGIWTEAASLAHARYVHTATLLPNGKVLLAGGEGPIRSAELYDVGLGFRTQWQPKIRRLKLGGKHLLLTGSLFQGISQASGGNTQDSSSNYPIVQLRSIDNSQVVFAPVDPAYGWSDTSFTSLPLSHFPFGPALVTVFTNGIPSTAKYLVVETQP
jgi:hypothetical protein